MTDNSREWWEDPKEALKRFGKWKDPSMVLFNHLIRSIPEPRREWREGEDSDEEAWNQLREKEIESQIGLLLAWESRKNIVASEDRDYLETKLLQVLNQHKSEERARILSEQKEKEAPTHEEIILRLHKKSVSTYWIARQSDFPEETVITVIRRHEERNAYSPTSSFTDFLKSHGSERNPRRSTKSETNKFKLGKAAYFVLIALGIILLILITSS